MIERLKLRREAAGEGGFTLIELLVVIIILGILAAVVVFAVGGVGDKGQSAACVIDTRTLRTAQEAYFASEDGGHYTDEATLEADGFLSEQSVLHDITLPAGQDATNADDFQIVIGPAGAGPGKCGAAVGDPVPPGL